MPRRAVDVFQSKSCIVEFVYQYLGRAVGEETREDTDIKARVEKRSNGVLGGPVAS